VPFAVVGTNAVNVAMTLVSVMCVVLFEIKIKHSDYSDDNDDDGGDAAADDNLSLNYQLVRCALFYVPLVRFSVK